MPRLSVSAVVLMCLSGCGVSPPDTTRDASELVVSLESGRTPTAEDPVSVEGLSISGDSLVLDVSYGGGCVEHEFGLSWEGTFAESNPVQARLTLLHESHDDMCLALLKKRLRVDLTPMKTDWQSSYGRTHGAIELLINGSTATARYEF